MSAMTPPINQNTSSDDATVENHCLVCNREQTANLERISIESSLASGHLLSSVMVAILESSLPRLGDQVPVVCVVCFCLLKEIDNLEHRVTALKGSVRLSFAQACRERGRQWDVEVASKGPAEERGTKGTFVEDVIGDQTNGSCTTCERSTQTDVNLVLRREEDENAQQQDSTGAKCAQKPDVRLAPLPTWRRRGRCSRVSTSEAVAGDGGVWPNAAECPGDPGGSTNSALVVSPGLQTTPAPPRTLRRRPTLVKTEPGSNDVADGDGAGRNHAPDDGPPDAAAGSASAASPDPLAAPAPRRALRRRPTLVKAEPVLDVDTDGHSADSDGAVWDDTRGDGLQCEMCGAECADASELERHRRHCGPPTDAEADAVLWSCQRCERSFRQLPQLKRHTRQHKLPTRQLAICLKCGAVFGAAAELVEHNASHAADAPDILICNVCGLGFRSAPALAVHAGKHDVTCTVCYKQLRKDSLREHMRRHTGETRYTCAVCSKKFVAFSSLRAHRRTHTGDKPHKCHLCAEMFHVKASLAEHLERHQGAELRCEQCSRVFPSSRRLAAHAKTHDRRRWQPHTCEFCGQGFMTARSLRQHRTQHLGTVPFVCPVCQKGFTYEDSYKEHLNVHSGQRPFTCEVCGKSFGRRSCLWAHRNQHTNPRRFPCGHCPKVFSNKSAYTVHLRIHTGEKPYKCTTCSGSFRLLSRLKRHACAPPAAAAAAAVAPGSAPGTAPPVTVQISTPGGQTTTAHIQLPAAMADRTVCAAGADVGAAAGMSFAGRQVPPDGGVASFRDGGSCPRGGDTGFRG
ncbi:zinc finger protein 497-like [Pollicipes pollicipes]|uniref:zinc finger protein 497-like n=1 Tax=Pollicipes pollicipes TaxID=41117 RepID=UPI001885989D|nr:zinc finger protein 497-like [Pollicipes pollicipes]